jgi:hypothetical protein
VQCPPLHPTSEVCYDTCGAECVWCMWGYIRAPPLYTGIETVI